MNHLQTAWANRVQAWNEPDMIRGYPLPHGGQFAQSKRFLDPDIFDEHNVMHPWIRRALLAILGAFWKERYPDWEKWTRIYLAGSLASYWWGTPDFDTLIGINIPVFIRSHSEFRGMSEAEVSKALTQEFYTGLDPLTDNYTFPPSADTRNIVHVLDGHIDIDSIYDSVPEGVTPFGPMEVTWYVNANSWDIRRIRPYAAYEILENKWWVYPSIVSKKWGPTKLPHNFWEKMADKADAIKHILAIGNPTKRQQEAEVFYNKIHEERSDAFSQGYGIGDLKSLQWVVLNRWGLLGPLEQAVHPDRPMAHVPPTMASIRMQADLHDLQGTGQGGMERIFPEGTPKVSSPFGMAGRRKDVKDYEADKVKDAIQHPEEHMDSVDPSTLRGTQPHVIRQAVDHYMNNDYRKTDETWGDQGNVGNRHPFVYTRHGPGDRVEHLLLAGHHRALSDLLNGKKLRCIHVHGGWGPPR